MTCSSNRYLLINNNNGLNFSTIDPSSPTTNADPALDINSQDGGGSDAGATRSEGVVDLVLETGQGGYGHPVNAILSCRGVPGSGKTFIDTLCEEAVGVNILSINDIKGYSREKLDSHPDPEAVSASLRSRVVVKITKNFSGVLKFPSSYYPHRFDIGRGDHTRERKRTPRGENWLRRCQLSGPGGDKVAKRPKGRLGIVALTWIPLAEQPLSGDGRCRALSVGPRSPDPGTGFIPWVDAVVGSCTGMDLVPVDGPTPTAHKST
ncbi:hypothetical protein HOY80DRAFT_1096808 [Tuber brumale]|nr:hypothetical protein HOY80DRAFT_1096808 [Tuber brumale]